MITYTISELKLILEKHSKWWDDEEGGECANLRGANLRGANLSGANLSGANLRDANLILVGQDIRGYLFWAYQGEGEILTIQAGCRKFVGIEAARSHWTERHKNDEVLHADCLSLVDRCEKMATVRGWKLEEAATVAA